MTEIKNTLVFSNNRQPFLGKGCPPVGKNIMVRDLKTLFRVVKRKIHSSRPDWQEIIKQNIDYNLTLTVNPALSGDSRSDANFYNMEYVTERMDIAIASCPLIESYVGVMEYGKNKKPHMHALLKYKIPAVGTGSKLTLDKVLKKIRSHFNNTHNFNLHKPAQACITTCVKPIIDNPKQMPCIKRWLTHPTNAYLRKEDHNKNYPKFFK